MRLYAALGVMVLMAVGCSARQQPARAALRSAASAVTVALSPGADKFDPDGVTALQRKLAHLKLAYEHGDYSAVIDSAPGVTADANELLQTVSADERTETRQRSVAAIP